MRIKRKAMAALVLVVLMVGMLPAGSTAHAAGGVEINKKNFPDDNFRKCVSYRDTDGDGVLSQAELDAVVDIVCVESDISDLTGIEYFTSIDTLHCGGNNLTSLDLSNNTKLISLECSYNPLTSLDVSCCPDLRDLTCFECGLTSLNFGNIRELREIECNDNRLTSIDLTGQTELMKLFCWNNDLEFIDVSGIRSEWLNIEKDDDVMVRSTAVTGFTNNGTDRGITVEWTNVEWYMSPIATGFTLRRRLSTESEWTILAEGIRETSYTDTDAGTAGAEYVYSVLPENGDSHWVYSADESVVRNPFADVETGTAAFTRIAWAYNSGIVSGTGKTAFSPNSPCTRAQFALMLYKLYGKPSVSGMECPFTDIGSLTSNNRKAIIWAYNSGIVGGTSATTFSPKSNITRAQLVLMLYKAAGSPKVSGSTPFTDLDGLSSNNKKAILWAYQNGIVGGTSATTFSPKNNCTRGQLVTMLYKYNKLLGLIPS